MSAFTLRTARQADQAAVWSIYQSVLGLSGCTWDNEYPRQADLTQDCQAGCLYVLELDGLVVGAASVVPENELEDLRCWTGAADESRELARVAILRAYQGHGYGRELIRQLLSVLSAKGCGAVRLLAAEGNGAAIQTYRSLGFRQRGVCQRYGHSYLCMELMLI